jgi:hypothetical protein
MPETRTPPATATRDLRVDCPIVFQKSFEELAETDTALMYTCNAKGVYFAFSGKYYLYADLQAAK